MPTLPLTLSPTCLIIESSRSVPLAANLPSVPVVPLLTAAVFRNGWSLAESSGEAEVPAPSRSRLGSSRLGSVSTKADSGLPPSVSASAAFSAYGTLTSSARGCSASPGDCACTPSQRDSPELNSSSGAPSLVVAPSNAPKRPSASAVTFCVSIHSGAPPC